MENKTSLSEEKTGNNIYVIIISSVLATALVVGGIFYFLLNQKTISLKTTYNSEINGLKNKISENEKKFSKMINDYDKQIAELKDEIIKFEKQDIVEDIKYLNKDYQYEISLSSDWKEVVSLHDGALGEITFQGDYIVLEKDNKSILFWYHDDKNTSFSNEDKKDLTNWYINKSNKNIFSKYDYQAKDIYISGLSGKEIYIPDWTSKNTVTNRYNYLLEINDGLLTISTFEKDEEIEDIIKSIKFVK